MANGPVLFPTHDLEIRPTVVTSPIGGLYRSVRRYLDPLASGNNARGWGTAVGDR